MSNNERAKEQAQAQLDSIVEIMDAFDKAREDGEAEFEGETCSESDLEERIQEGPLSVEVRSGWHSPGTPAEAEEFMLLLCTGGPAVRITGDLGQYNTPENVRIEYQDWFTSWERLSITDDHALEQLVAYARCFYYGE